MTAYYEERPDPTVPAQRVLFGTSGIYAESYRGEEHLRRIENEARAVINRVCAEAHHPAQ